MSFAKSIFFLLLTLSIFASADPAEETQTVPESQTLLELSPAPESPIEIHGFLSQGFLRTTQNNYIPNSTEGTTDFAEAGLNLNKQLATNLRLGMQLFARDFGRTGNYNARFDWFLVDYHWRDWLGIRIGRTKIPYGLYNETNDVDIARVPILLPQSVYPSDQRDYLLAQTGLDLYGFIDVGAGGSLEYRLYRGTLQIPATSTVGSPIEVATSDVPYVHGSRLIWNTPLDGLRIGGSYQDLQYNSDLYVRSIPKTIAMTLKVKNAVGSIEYIHRNFQIAIEASRWWGDVESDTPTLVVPVSVSNDRYYGMFSYRVKDWFQPGVFYSELYPNGNVKDAIKDYSKDTAVFFRLDLTQNWIFKGEWHYMNGTAGLNSQMNNNKTQNAMEQYWQMFMAKTTIYF